MLVIANAPEDQLPVLRVLDPSERHWTIRTVGVTAADDLPGPIERIGWLIDPNPHTAVIEGYVDNSREVLRGGQTVSATVRIPSPPALSRSLSTPWWMMATSPRLCSNRRKQISVHHAPC